MPKLEIRFSSQPGRIPTVDELDGYKFGWNFFDGIYYGVKKINGVKEVVAIGSGGSGGLNGLTPFIGTNGNWWIGEEDTGVQAAGTDGESAFVYIAYASDASGTGFTLTFDAALDYIAILTTTTEISLPDVSDFVGLWKNYKGAAGADGADGADGSNGIDGDDGTNAYLYIAYASDDIGTDFSLSPGASLTYIAALSTDTEIVTPQASDFTGLWRKYVGEDGTPADLTHYCYIAWRDAPGDGFTLTPNINLAFEAILVSHVEIETPVEADFYGLWRERVTPSGPFAPKDIILPRTLIGLTANGIKTSFIANETQIFGDVCFINSAGKTQIGNATVIATATIVAMCIDPTIAADAEGNYLLIGFANNNEWAWTVGGEVYLSLNGTSGNTLTQTSPFDLDPIVEDRVVQLLGIAKTATSIYFNPQLVQVELKP